MKNQMKNKYCLDEKDWQKAKAVLLLAKNFGLILDDTVEALEERRKEKNEENRHKQEKGELFYGPYFYTPPMYIKIFFCLVPYTVSTHIGFICYDECC